MSAASLQLSRRLPPWPIWIGSLAVWTFLSAITAWSNLQNALRAGRELAAVDEIVRVLIGTVPWAISMPLIIWFSARRLIDGPDRWPRIGAILGIGLLWLVAAVLIVSWPRSIMGGRPYLEQLRLHFDSGKAAFFFEYSSLVLYAALGQAIGFWDRARQREIARLSAVQELAEARLANLRMQVHPHFIFNALNSVAALVRRGDAKQAVSMIVGLAELMREAMREDGPGVQSLEAEFALMTRYLRVEQLRYGERLRVEVELPTALYDVEVPTLIVQPLVENAIRHGVAGRHEPVTVRLVAVQFADTIQVKVSDDGPPLPEAFDPAGSSGLGLALTRRRLALWRERGDLELSSTPAGVEAVISFRVSTAPGAGA